jgi:hypothetical protein
MKPGVQAAAFVLPNDEKVRQAKGSKKVMLKNVAEAKFRSCTIPIAGRIIAEQQLALVDFDALFNFVLMHELAHSMGPSFISLPDGSETTVSRALKHLHPTVEETKADVAGMCNLLYLIDKGVLSGLEKACVSYVVSLFRSIRFGIDEAHGRAGLIELNYHLERGGIVYDGVSGRFEVDFALLREGIRDLTGMVLTLQAQARYHSVKELLGNYGVLTPLLQEAMERVRDIPVDIEPRFPIERMIKDW